MAAQLRPPRYHRVSTGGRRGVKHSPAAAGCANSPGHIPCPVSTRWSASGALADELDGFHLPAQASEAHAEPLPALQGTVRVDEGEVILRNLDSDELPIVIPTPRSADRVDCTLGQPATHEGVPDDRSHESENATEGANGELGCGICR